MATIDLATLPIRTANEVIRGYGATHQNIDILNPDAKHYIAVGLTHPVNVSIKGSAGYFCGGLTDGPHLHIENNASWGVGDNMLSGSIVVGGNAGAIAGEALRGGEIVIKGNMGSRAGQVMKKGTLCCAGDAGFMAGYMMYGGRMIILGNSGEKVGENMAGGQIFVGGTIDSLGADAECLPPTDEEIDEIMTFLEHYGIPFSGSFKKVTCRGKDLSYGKTEPRLKSIPFTRFSGEGTPLWNEKVQEDIRVKSDIGRYRIRGYGTARPLPHFGDIAFKQDLSLKLNNLKLKEGQHDIPLSTTLLPPEKNPLSDTKTKHPKNGTAPQMHPFTVALRTFIGARNGGRALDLSMPVMIAPMSLGALSPKVKIALGIASRLSGICDNTGEGGMYSMERAEAQQLIAQCLSGRLGWSIHDMKRADAIELYISQGAKPGLGGQLMAKKLTREIADMRGIPHGMDLRSPSRHPDVLGGDDLIMKVAELREAVGWRLPVGLKLGGGRTRDDVKIAYKDGIDYVALDGLQGGTGAGSSEVIEYVGIPTLSALMEAMDGLDEIDAKGELPIVLMGGIQTGVDAAKAIALGATAVALGTPMLVAAGCTGCMQCSSGACPLGITTQTPEYVDRFDVPQQALAMHHYLESFRWQLAAVTTALGRSDIHDLSREDLVALTPEAAALTRLPYAPEYGDNGYTFSYHGFGTGILSDSLESGSSNPLETVSKETIGNDTLSKKNSDDLPSKGSNDDILYKEANEKKETGSATFPKRSRQIIKRMTRTPNHEFDAQQRILEAALMGRPNPFPPTRGAHLDDVVFLSAALTRLVIDPYREACNTKTCITRSIEVGPVPTDTPKVDLSYPFLFAGFDDAPPVVKKALARAIAKCGCAYIGRRPLVDFPISDSDPMEPQMLDPHIPGQLTSDRHSLDGHASHRHTLDGHASDHRILDPQLDPHIPARPLFFQLLLPGDTPLAQASGLIYISGEIPIEMESMERIHPNQLLGVCADAKNLPVVLPQALKKKLDILLLDATTAIGDAHVEVNSTFDFTLIRDAIFRLRSMKQEEEICLINFGGMRSGTDVAKCLALNCNASIFSTAMAFAMGGILKEGKIHFSEPIRETSPHRAPQTPAAPLNENENRDEADRIEEDRLFEAAVNWIEGSAQETAVIARCAGKTNIHNLEPEDMRSISIATSEALGIALASGAVKRERF